MSHKKTRMNLLTNIRKVLLIAAAIFFIFCLAMIFSGNWINLINLLISLPFITVFPILLVSTAISTSIILELIGVGISGKRWPDKKHFRFYIPVWIILIIIQTIGIVLSKSHPPIGNS